ERLLEDAENQLRRGGVKVLPMGEFHTGDPHLQIVLRTSELQDGRVASQVEVRFIQIVFLRRNPLVTFNRAQTWSANTTISLGRSDQLAPTDQHDMERQHEQFSTDYRHGNP